HRISATPACTWCEANANSDTGPSRSRERHHEVPSSADRGRRGRRPDRLSRPGRQSAVAGADRGRRPGGAGRARRRLPLAEAPDRPLTPASAADRAFWRARAVILGSAALVAAINGLAGYILTNYQRDGVAVTVAGLAGVS